MRIALWAALAAALALAPLGVAAEQVLGRLGDIVIEDGRARAAGAAAKTGAAYMRIVNGGATDDRLVATESPAARRVELHTHIIEDGVARMRQVEGGIPIPAGATVTLESGGLHVMFLGLTAPFPAGGTVELTLVFEAAGEIAVEVPVEPMPGVGQDAGH